MIGRALTDDMVDPKRLPGCEVLESVLLIDDEAADELSTFNNKLLNLTRAAQAASKNASESGTRISGSANARQAEEAAEAFEKALSFSRAAQRRIENRVDMINDRIDSECRLDKQSRRSSRYD